MSALTTTQKEMLLSLPWGDSLIEAMSKYPSKASFSRAVGTPASNVHNWVQGARISIECAKKIEACSGVPKEKLRPDVRPEEWDLSKKDQLLLSTKPGRALKTLLDKHGGTLALASSLGIYDSTVQKWAEKGKVSKRGARLVESVLGVKKEKMRPDLTEKDWLAGEPGKGIMEEFIPKTDDSRLLIGLADKFGSVKELCAAAFCTPGDYHTWKSRGRIPAIKLPTFLALNR